jgi:hypothetical protein
VSGLSKSELQGDKAGKHWEAIAKLAAQAFPDYALPYMVQYGVYGFATSVAR